MAEFLFDDCGTGRFVYKAKRNPAAAAEVLKIAAQYIRDRKPLPYILAEHIAEAFEAASSKSTVKAQTQALARGLGFVKGKGLHHLEPDRVWKSVDRFCQRYVPHEDDTPRVRERKGVPPTTMKAALAYKGTFRERIATKHGKPGLDIKATWTKDFWVEVLATGRRYGGHGNRRISARTIWDRLAQHEDALQEYQRINDENGLEYAQERLSQEIDNEEHAYRENEIGALTGHLAAAEERRLAKEQRSAKKRRPNKK